VLMCVLTGCAGSGVTPLNKISGLLHATTTYHKGGSEAHVPATFGPPQAAITRKRDALVPADYGGGMGRQMIGSAPRSGHSHHNVTCVLGLAACCARVVRGLATPENRGRREGRELASPMARLQQKTQAAGTTGSAEGIPTFPARWCYDLYALFRGPDVLPPSPAMMRRHHRKTWHRLRDARTTRLHRRVGIVRPHEKPRAAIRHAHRIPHPTSVTTAKRPPCGTGWGDQTMISDRGNKNILTRKTG
jgi:hypothetical protein